MHKDLLYEQVARVGKALLDQARRGEVIVIDGRLAEACKTAQLPPCALDAAGRAEAPPVEAAARQGDRRQLLRADPHDGR
jgi:hypothetical protein